MAEIVIDGGFSRGTDIIKGLARGAKVVACGRTALWGLGADGAEGVANALAILRHEVETSMGLCGRTTIASLTPELIFRVD
jgi:isopentenyl diphosphate isomerase/L-lactate dehydrogenase-like FMN-dependent dehydrogenase